MMNPIVGPDQNPRPEIDGQGERVTLVRVGGPTSYWHESQNPDLPAREGYEVREFVRVPPAPAVPLVPEGVDDEVADAIVNAQAELQIALGVYRLAQAPRGSLSHEDAYARVEPRLAETLRQLHVLLLRFGVEMLHAHDEESGR